MNFTLPIVFTVFKISNVICLRQPSVLNKYETLLNQSSFNKLSQLKIKTGILYIETKS